MQQSLIQSCAFRGKPKKGRTGQRELKKIRLSSDLDPDEDDDLDLR